MSTDCKNLIDDLQEIAVSYSENTPPSSFYTKRVETLSNAVRETIDKSTFPNTTLPIALKNMFALLKEFPISFSADNPGNSEVITVLTMMKIEDAFPNPSKIQKAMDALFTELKKPGQDIECFSPYYDAVIEAIPDLSL